MKISVLLLTVMLSIAVASSALLPGTARAVVENCDFEGDWYEDDSQVPPADMIPDAWLKHETPGAPTESSWLGPIEENGPSYPGEISLHWWRYNGGASGDWTTVEQELDINVGANETVQLSLDIKVLFHDLGGGGWTTGEWEYPVTVIIFFTDTDGIERAWQFGWYAWWDSSVGEPVNGYVTPNGLKIVYTEEVDYNQWHTQSFDLGAQLATLAPPETITRIRIGGSGWSFEGVADNVCIDLGPTAVITTTWGAIKALY